MTALENINKNILHSLDYARVYKKGSFFRSQWLKIAKDWVKTRRKVRSYMKSQKKNIYENIICVSCLKNNAVTGLNFVHCGSVIYSMPVCNDCKQKMITENTCPDCNEQTKEECKTCKGMRIVTG